VKTCYIDTDTRTIADLVEPGNLAEPAELSSGWCITRINVPAEHRGRGHGTAILKRLLADADEEQVVLWLEVLSSGPLDRNALTAWYERYGFELRPAGYMIRIPDRH